MASPFRFANQRLAIAAAMPIAPAPEPIARAFAAELESGATEFHALVGNFILCAILGKKPMLGDPIKSEQVRMTAAIFYAKTNQSLRAPLAGVQAGLNGRV